MTEEEAKTKWCPFARAIDPEYSGGVNRVVGSNSEPDSDCFCMASACMMWRWKKVDALVNRETREIKMIESVTIYNEATHLKTKLISNTDGHCGLAGKP